MLGIAAYNYARTNYPAEPKTSSLVLEEVNLEDDVEKKKFGTSGSNYPIDTPIVSIIKPVAKSPSIQLRKGKSAPPAEILPVTRNASSTKNAETKRSSPTNKINDGKPRYLGGNVFMV